MRCWTPAELQSVLSRNGFRSVAYFGAYDPAVAQGATDRLVAVAQLSGAAAQRRLRESALPHRAISVSTADITITEVDPQGKDALTLLREAAIEARELYPEPHRPGAPWPTNPATPARGTYLVAYVDGEPLACGALRPLDEALVEVRRMFVARHARRRGLGRAILRALETAACRLGYQFMRLQTGNRQLPAMALYTSYGFARIERFGEYVDDPTSVCYEKAVQALE